jgi:oxygen-independent coproporphyrinogen-3 oxidase
MLEQLEAILPRYETAAPRYTSYPTAPAWGDDYGPDEYRRDLGAVEPGAPLSLYAHVPFCRSLCHFCACNRVITRDEALPARYLEAVEREVAAVRAAIPEPGPVSQVHWGGGTPTHLDPDQLRRLFAALTDPFSVADDAEISIEVDPRVTSGEQLQALRECGFNRISMGVQDFEPQVQEAIHRTQSAEQTAELVASARRLGFQSVSLDLIYGLPFQRPETFERTLKTVLDIGPDRVALYGYAHVTWVAKQQRGFERKDLPDAPTRLGVFTLAIRRFLEAGYVHVGMDHFARPEDELVRALRERTLRRNFMGYTTQAGVDLLGFGPSAISELSGSFAQSHRDLDAWEDAVRTTGFATMRGHVLTDEDRVRRWVISRIMCLGEVRAAEFEALYGGVFAERFAPELARLETEVADGLVVREADGSLTVTELGRILIRNVASVFDAYLGEQRKLERPLFSKTV